MGGFFNPKRYEDKPSTNLKDKLPQCGKCKLARTCYSPKMKPMGKGVRKVLFVAEAPGAEEDRQGEQLVGDSGKLLRRTLRDLGVDLEDCWKTHAVICHPPKNKIEPFMISACRPNLHRTIDELDPDVIVALGGSALSSLLYGLWKREQGEVSRWAGRVIPVHQFGVWMCPTYHPSFLLRKEEDEVLMAEFRAHLKAALSFESTPLPEKTLEDYEREVEIVKNEDEIVSRLEALSRAKKGILAFDYETNMLKPESEKARIVSVSFCLDGQGAFAFMLKESHLLLLRGVLTNPHTRKIASNLKFEDRWTHAILGVRVKRWYWDTMQMAHVLDNHPGITSVKFQAFVRLGVADYDSHLSSLLKQTGARRINQIHKIPEQDLLVYNALDSLLEYEVYKHQKEEMNARCTL
jgi:uracil-DNA glycosylase